MKEFLNRALQLESLAIVGMEKNVGKTTVLNYIIEGARGRRLLGLTSIGIDGEAKDLVTGTEKPRIYVPKGTLLATAKGALASSDLTKEILDTTGIQTPMGEVIILRALSDGFIELMGPSFNSGLKLVLDKLKTLGCETILIDGALNRCATADPSVSEGILLATGAAVAADLEGVASATQHRLQLLSIEAETDNKILPVLINGFQQGKLAFIREAGLEVTTEATALGAESIIVNSLNSGASAVIIKGVVVDRLVQQLLRHVEKPEGKTIYVEDGTKLFINNEGYLQLLRKGYRIRGLNPIRVMAVSVNPFSPLGYSLDSRSLCVELYNRVGLPIVDVVSNIGVGL